MKLSYNDKWHSYYLDGTRCKGVTTIAKIPDDTYTLTQWMKRQVVRGMAVDDTLISRAQAHFDDRKDLGDIAEDAMRAAKSHEAAARGTAIHRILERHDLGEEIIDTPYTRALRAAYDKALDAAGLEVVTEYTERIVVYPKDNIAGRLDRIVKRKRDGKLAIADVKSGMNAVKYPHSTAVQLATYANAPLMAGHVPREGGETELFEKLPEKLDKHWAYIVHAPDENTVEVVKIDIAAGWRFGFKAAKASLEWRAHTDLIVPVGSTSVDDLMAPASEERVTWIKGRLKMMTMLDEADKAKTLVAASWPADVAKPRQTDKKPWTESDVELLDEMLIRVETECHAPFPIKDPQKKNMRSA